MFDGLTSLTRLLQAEISRMHSLLNCIYAFFQRLYFHGKTIYTVLIKVGRVINLEHPQWTDRDFPHHRFLIVWL
jgi:hypothetical protein